MGFEVTIENIQNNKIKIDKQIKNGMSGIVLCPYENKKIICARAILFGTKGRLEVYDDLENPAFALPIVMPKAGDKIIVGKNYNRVMIIAPNQDAYLKVKTILKNKTFISSDIFATFLDDIPTKKDFINFAKKLDIGLYAFVLDKLYLVDAYSFYVVKEINFNNNYKYNKPFFTTYKKFEKGSLFSRIFSKNVIDYKKYYKNMIKE
jgi:hypothetical protein